MRAVKFTQYLLPDGLKSPVSVERPDDIADKADLIYAAGFTLECEVLTTGHVSFTIADEDQDYAMKICENGPGVLDSVDALIREFRVADAVARRNILHNPNQ